MRIVALAAAAAALCGSSGAAVPGAIDCAKAAAADERAVCRSHDLGQLDAQMATQYTILKGLVPMGARGALMDTQREWQGTRSACGRNRACLKRAYHNRIDALQTELDRIKAMGPF